MDICIAEYSPVIPWYDNYCTVTKKALLLYHDCYHAHTHTHTRTHTRTHTHTHTHTHTYTHKHKYTHLETLKPPTSWRCDTRALGKPGSYGNIYTCSLLHFHKNAYALLNHLVSWRFSHNDTQKIYLGYPCWQHRCFSVYKMPLHQLFCDTS